MVQIQDTILGKVENYLANLSTACVCVREAVREKNIERANKKLACAKAWYNGINDLIAESVAQNNPSNHAQTLAFLRTAENTYLAHMGLLKEAQER